MIKNIILQQREERDSLLMGPYIERMSSFRTTDYLSSPLIKLVTGPRRAGKSVLSLQMLRNENFAYLNFDDDQLLKNFEEDEIIRSLHEVYPGFRFLLLDEIQNLPGWEVWVNKLHRRGANLVLTGSNARLLSHEMATVLTGRVLEIAVFPFSFLEYLQYFNLTLQPNNEETPKTTGGMLNLLSNYLQRGGFPETIIHPQLSKNYLASLFDSVLLKDIVKRFKIRRTQQFYDLAKYLLANFTNPYSFNQLCDRLNFNSVATVQKFIGMLEEPYLFLNLTCYRNKIREQLKSNRKIYVIDNGFVKACTLELSPEYGRLLENTIFIELIRRNFRPGIDLFYYKTRNNREVDFLCKRNPANTALIQVCYDISDSRTLKRELDALTEASTELSSQNLLLINWNRNEEIMHNGILIKTVPAWKWLSDQQEG
jgi:predicted AAA+ superfamily ATPase